jgi:alcohol dehydrogenase (cytochrome c)
MSGGKNFQAGAYSPQTNVMYYGLENICMDVTADPNASHYGINARQRFSPGTDRIGSLFAISAETGKTLWKYDQRAGMMSVVATGGGLIFAGDTNGHFRAFDQRDGSILWDVNLGSQIRGYPITYTVRGKQYVAVTVGGDRGGNVLAPELSASNSNNIFVFALPQ